MNSELVIWLEVQLDDEEREAAADHEPRCSVHAGRDGDLLDPDLCNCRVHHRLLDIAAKRRLIDDYEEASAGEGAFAAGLELAVRDLSLAYTDRSGYHEEWRP
jgi:hypothetical protein